MNIAPENNWLVLRKLVPQVVSFHDPWVLEPRRPPCIGPTWNRAAGMDQEDDFSSTNQWLSGSMWTSSRVYIPSDLRVA